MNTKAKKVNYGLSEHNEQALVIAWIDLQDKMHPHLGLGMRFAVPNGAKRGPWESTQKRREGMRAGVPDLCIPVPLYGYHGLWIEMKRLKGGKTSPEQVEYIAELTRHGHLAKICYGADDAIKTISGYFGIPVG